MYGETSFDLINQMIKSINFTENDFFIDLGSGKLSFSPFPLAMIIARLVPFLASFFKLNLQN